MKRFFQCIVFISLLTVSLVPAELFSQSREFRVATQYMQQQNYEEALPILRDLHENNPSAYTFFDRLAETLINLKFYDEAIEVAQESITNGYNTNRARIKLAEIYHVSGQKERAMESWQKVIDDNSRQIQFYHNVASSMADRREYIAAIELYEQSRQVFDNTTLFSNEIANAYMQSGQYEKAVNEYYRVIEESPEQMSFVQQRFLRMRDDQLYSVATLELEDFLLNLEMGHPAYSQLYQLLSWLLIETEEYRRAFIFARQFESRTSQTNYSLFSMGNRFRSARQYELAAEAYDYYIESVPSLQMRAMEEKANTYLQWARYLEQSGLETSTQRDNLFEEAYKLSESILQTAPNYNRKERVLTNLIDLSLDYYKDLKKAERWHREISNYSNSNTNAGAYTLYSEGRIALFSGNHSLARQALTRADRETDDSNLSEKTRYYLSLSDFFAGDFEFAEIQLKSLERRNTSYFANNAIQLRMWIKNGTRKDSTAAALKEFSESLKLLHTGSYHEAIETSSAVLANNSHPFSDDLAAELAKNLPYTYLPVTIMHLQNQVEANTFSPIRERLMWERAVAFEQLTQLKEKIFEQESHFEQYLGDFDFEEYLAEWSAEEMYENILLEFPNGFYARYAREKLQQQPPAQTL